MRRLLRLIRFLALASVIAPSPVTAALLGYHDISDPVKSAGWACDSGSDAPLRVRLVAQLPDGPRLVDTQLADQPRGDLGAVCNGTRHAFRFADYAANGLGSALYDTTQPVVMQVLAETAAGLVPIAGTNRPVSFAATGLWDPGLVDGRWRTDYDNPLEGTAVAPLLLGTCPFATPVSDGYTSFSGGGPDFVNNCRYGQTVLPQSNAASSDGTWPNSRYWAVVANVEDALQNPLCVDGPPGQSLPVLRPGQGGVFGLVALPDGEAGRPDRLKMHLVLNSAHWEACRRGSYGGPYLAFAAQADRGNDGVITYLNRSGAPARLAFGLTLMDIAPDPAPGEGAPAGARRYSQAHVLVEVLWAGRRRWLFIELVPDVRRVAGTAEGTVDTHVRFNWHMVNSFMHPGADYLFKSGTVLTRQCAQEGVAVPVLDRAATWLDPATRGRARRDYTIDLQRVFDCLNRLGAWGAEPMPAHAVPVTNVMFGVEQDDQLYADGNTAVATAPNRLWVAVDGVRID